MKVFRSLVLVSLVAAMAPHVPAAVASSEAGRYVVVLREDADPEATARRHEARYGAKADRYFRSALKGYAANVPEDRVAEMRKDPSVMMVSRNRQFRAAIGQTTPTGVGRIKAPTVPGTGDGVQVAVLDSGIDLDHPDLAGNIAGGADCDGPDNNNYDDANGHGTHVAGTIAAIDNAVGVVGVAPLARLWAVRVLSASGGGDDVSLICGLDFVDARAPANGGAILVANMSLEAIFPDTIDDGNCGLDIGDPVHFAACEVVADGVAIIAAAGNSGIDLRRVAPAAYDEVIAVTALADYDGAPCSVDPAHADDDTFAGFSNYATLSSDKAHTIAAPGVDILSTYIGGTIAYSDGTSMATPHVAGTAARYLQTHPGTAPASLLQVLLDGAEPEDVDFNGECSGSAFSHTDPSALHPEPVVRVDDWDISIQASTPGIVRGNKWFLNNAFLGNADLVFNYGSSTDRVIVGDWDGDGVDTPGIVRGNVWYLNDGFDPFSEYVFAYGSASDRIVVGDWDDDGSDEPGIVRGNQWFLNDGLDPNADHVFFYGRSTDKVVAGDWDGDGMDTPGIVRGNLWYLNDQFDANADTVFGLGATTDAPIVGDWNGDGIDLPGVHRSNKWFLNLGFDSGAEIVFLYGLSADRFVVGDWDGETP